MGVINAQARVAIVYGVPAGGGGLGLQAASAITAFATGESIVHAFGPGRVEVWPLPGGVPDVVWHESPPSLPAWMLRYSWWRWYQGHYQLQCDRRLGSWARQQIERLQPERCYVFTQVGLETLRWARRAGVPTVLDNPNGHLRFFRSVCERESLRWNGRKYKNHPSRAMLERVEEEYELADRIRVSSEWAKNSMIQHGVRADKIEVISQPLNLKRFSPPDSTMDAEGPLRVCYVGSMDLRKGFLYLLRSIKLVGSERVNLEIVGATGDRSCRLLLEREKIGLQLKHAAGNPVPAYHRSEVFVLPSLEDGFGFVVAEAMACGLPVIVTEDCGAAGWVRHGETGWIIPSGRVDALADALNDALRRRAELKEMGRLARADVEERADPACLNHLREWVYQNNL
jgi:glycosyltransferase involved in cell wall biosynthesis